MARTKSPKMIQVDIEYIEGGLSVTPVWAGVDRPISGGWHVKDDAIADRLAEALLAGAVYLDAEVKVDVSGKTYVHGRSLVNGRTANADLRRLGF